MTQKDYIAIAAQYQADVLNGTIPACKWVKLAAERNRRDLDRQETDAFPYRFDPESATAICRFGEMLPFVSGKGFSAVLGRDELDRPIYKLFELQPWQVWILTCLFGWKNDRDLRRFRVALILVPRKNGKSNLCAIIALYMLTQEGEPGAQVISAATTREQAKNIADVAWEMANRSPLFREFYGVKMGSQTMHSLSVPETASKFMALSSDANSLDGLNISCGLVDEFQNHKTAAVWNVVDTATSARFQPLIAGIGTAGETFGGICHSKLMYLEKVLDGAAVDETLFGVNYTIDATDDYRLPATARKANPNYGISVDPFDIERKVNECQHSAEAVASVLVKHFNVWLREETAWMGSTLWQTCGKPGLTIADLKHYPCWIGVDLAEVRDIAALVALFKTGADSYALIGRFYLPKAAVDKSPIAQLSGWVRDGFIIETEGDQADFLRIEDDIVAWCDQLQIKEIDFDRALAAQMQQSLKRRFESRMGRDAVDRFVVTVQQRVEEMNPSMQMIERLVLAKHLQHDGNPAMAWMISNIVVEPNYKDEKYPRKAGGKDSANKIDGPVALFTALSQAMKGQVEAPKYQMLFLGGGKA